MEKVNPSLVMKEKVKAALFGVAVGDALGVPVEFMSREAIAQNPVTGMLGYGTYDLPPGTWSDDSSMTFCTVESLSQGYSVQHIGETFVRWYKDDYWTPDGDVFDIGITTKQAIVRIMQGIPADHAGMEDEMSNGNGSLMRILPLIFHSHAMEMAERFECARQVSSITHRHIRSALACFYYLETARELLSHNNIKEAVDKVNLGFSKFLDANSEISDAEKLHFSRLLHPDFPSSEEYTIQSSGYVMHTLESSIWCLLNSHSYSEAVLKAVNLGKDTDTTAAVTGGLAGLIYGFDAIPKEWLSQLARRKDIEELAERFGNSILFKG